MNDIEVSSIDLVEGGNVFKQGHYLTLGYVPRDEKGETVDLSGKTLNVSLWGRKGVVFEAVATYSGGVIRFTLDKMVPAGDYTVEFTVTSSTDSEYRKKFPTNQHSGRIAIKQSADDLGVVGIQVYTVAQLKAEQKAIQTQYESTLNAKVQATDAKSTTALTKSTAAEAAAQDVKNQFEQVVISGDSSVEAAAARVAPDQTFVSLKARLDAKEQATALQLAETVEMIPNMANGEFILNLLNPYGDFQNIHGKILHFPNGWNGYKYWMAYTPYPNGNWRFENPAIAVSNDKLNWKLPDGLANGILEDWNGVNAAYNNDTHAVFRTDLNRLEVWWRFVDENTDIVHLYRRTTQNGVDWTIRETMFTGNRKGDDHLSPAIVYEDGKYKMLSVNTVGSNRILNYTESTNGTNWGDRTEVNTEWNGLTPWHLDFINEGTKYTIVLQAWEQGKDNNTSNLYFLETTDLINLSKPIKILAPSTSPTAFDNAGIYRSTVLKEGDEYTVIYSAVSKAGKRAMSISQGTEIKALKGIKRDLGNLRMSPTVNNVYEAKQTTTPDKFGGIKVGNLLFANGVTDGVTPEDGAIRWNGTFRIHEKYDAAQSNWVTLVSPPSPTQAVLEKDSQQSLINNEWVEVDFNKVVVNNGSFANGRFIVPANGIYRFEVDLQLAGLLDGDAVEIYLMRNTARVRPLIRQVITPLSGNYFINNSAFYNLLQGQEMSIVVKYIGGSTSAYITGNATQNALLIERV